MEIRLPFGREKNKIMKLDSHIPPEALGECMHNGQVYVLIDDSVKNGGLNHRLKDPVVGVLRYGFFWQTIPFLDLIILDENYRNKGFGTKMMDKWESDMKIMGYSHVMTSTQADESAYIFYEKRGYKKAGGFFPPMQDAEEIIYVKEL
ncbi:MAG: GNAT family N-acetyltransferase [Ruminococcaceae bacterium]|nr:GNAT family N-acetyltransferase [Oscillospiraceae bacterium]